MYDMGIYLSGKEYINGDFILVLEFNKSYNRFEIKRIPIDRSLKHKEVYEKLCRMREDKSLLLEDLVNYFRKEIPDYTSLNYCFPYDYSNSYIRYVNVFEYMEDEIKKSKESESENHNQKSSFVGFNMKRWLNAYDYYQTLNKIKNNDDIKVWSSEAIGWTNIEYVVNNDLNVYVSTNFAYGWSSYFHLTLRYKDLLIIPYTDIIHYYHADIKEYRRCTRSYHVKRESWEHLFKYLEGASNLMLLNSNEFVRKYIVCEIDDVLRCLKTMQCDIHNKYWGIVERLTIKKSIPIASGWDMSEYEVKDYLDNRSEMDFGFVVGKIEAVKDVLLDSLNKLRDVYDKVDDIEGQIYGIINLIYPDVKEKADELSSILKGKEDEKLEKKTKLAELENDFKPIQEKCEDYIHQEEEKLPKDDSLSHENRQKRINDAIKQFKKDNPEYEKLKNEIEEKKKELSQIENDIIKIENFKDPLDSFLKEYQDSISS